MNINEQANFIWSIADLLRGDFKQSEYGKVILPFTVLRRFDCVLAPSKQRCTRGYKRYKETSGLIEWKECQIFHSIFT